MSVYDNDDDLFTVAQSCKLMKPRYSSGNMASYSEGVTCTLCSSWNGSRCTKRVLDNMLAGPDLD